MLMPGAALILPGVANALAARVVADCGFGAAYVTGAGIANSFLGIPDNGLVTLTELVDHVVAIREVFPGPLMVDADTGFGNALNMRRTIQVLERAGADAIQIEDQVFPKRCGHFEGKEVIPAAEMVAEDQGSGGRPHRSRSADRRAHRRHCRRRLQRRDGPRACVPRGRRRRRLRRSADSTTNKWPRSPGCRGRSSSTS